MQTSSGENGHDRTKSHLRSKKRQHSRLHVKQVLERICAKNHARLDRIGLRQNDFDDNQLEWHGEFSS